MADDNGEDNFIRVLKFAWTGFSACGVGGAGWGARAEAGCHKGIQTGICAFSELELAVIWAFIFGAGYTVIIAIGKWLQ